MKGPPEDTVILALAFGHRDGSSRRRSAGPINRQLAKIVERFDPDLLVMAEPEVASCLESQRRKLVVLSFADDHAGTRAVIRAALAEMQSMGIRRAVVVAHPKHRRRIQIVSRQEGLAIDLAPVVLVPSYDSSSAQWWTRGPIRWWALDLVARQFTRLRVL